MVAFGSVGRRVGGCPYPHRHTYDGVGNIVALLQDEHKEDARILTDKEYAGYMLLGISRHPDGMASVLNHMLIYGFMNIGALL
jgi:NADH:ubiquinone oxidoreductase subunit 2 (subunit N)